MTSQKPTDPEQKGTPKPKRPATPSHKSSSSEDDDTPDEQYMNYLLEWLSLDLDCQSMLDEDGGTP